MLVVVLMALEPRNAVAQAYPRVETAKALAQILKRVDPVIPPEATAKKVGGTVIADVVIAANGTVSSVAILDGHPLLQTAATTALRQWRFKPFLSSGRPSPVQVILEVKFPDPIADAANAVYKAHGAAFLECRRQMEIDPRAAERACAEAARTADQLPADRPLERSHSRSSHAMTLMALGRGRDALQEIEAAISARTAAVPSPDADHADLYHLAAFLTAELGERDKAAALYERAIREYAGAIEHLPSHRALYDPRLKATLQKYAAFKRASGDTTGAADLEKRAAGIATTDTAPAVAAPPLPPRSSGAVNIHETADARLSDADVETILKLVGSARAQVRHIFASAFNGGEGRAAEVFLEPRATGENIRRGRRLRVETGADGTAAADTWKARGTFGDYIQVRAVEDGPSAAWSMPIRVQAAPNRPPMDDAELARLVAFLRVKSRNTVSGRRLLSDVQPWPLTWIIEGDGKALGTPRGTRNRKTADHRDGARPERMEDCVDSLERSDMRCAAP